jgi:hypothetical protein
LGLPFLFLAEKEMGELRLKSTLAVCHTISDVPGFFLVRRKKAKDEWIRRLHLLL